MREQLEYYLERPPTDYEVAEAMEWKARNPHGMLAEWVEAMIEIGAIE